MNALESIKAELSKKGIVVPQSVLDEARAAALEAESAERAKRQEANGHKGRFERVIDGFIERYPRWQDSADKFGNLSMALIKLFSVNVFAFVILFGVSVAEIARVLIGLLAVESNSVVALILSTVLVLLVVFLNFGAYYLEREADYVAPSAYHWSLRIFKEDMKYLLGRDVSSTENGQWAIRKKSPARLMNLAKWFTQLAVSFIALYGAMFGTIKDHKGNYIEALRSILTESSLREMGSWVNGILITASILIGSAAMLYYVVTRASKLEGSDFVVGEDKIEAIGNEAAASVVRARAKQIVQGRYQTQLVSAADVPTYEHSMPIRIDASMQIDADSMHRSASNNKKPMQIALEWLSAHPNHGMSYRKASKEAGVSEGAMQRAMKK